MSLLDTVKAYFSAHETNSEVNVPEEEIAWGSSRLYGDDTFPQYNPDDLVARKGLMIYRKMMIDEQVKSVVRFRRNATTGRDFFFTAPNTDKLSDEEKEFRVDLFKHIIDDMPGVFKTRLDGIMTGMQYGFSLTEKVFQPTEFDGRTWEGIKSLKTKPAWSFEPFMDKYDNIIRLQQRVNGMLQDLDLDNFIHYVQNPDVNEFYGQSEIREAYRAYFSKDITIRLHNIWLERMAGGFVWATPEKGKTLPRSGQEFSTLKTALNSLRNNTSLIMPSGVKLEIMHPNDTEAFNRAVVMNDKSIAKALLVPNLLGLSEQGDTGSFAQSKTQLEAFLWDLDAEALYLEEIVNEQLFRHLGDINFGDGFYPRWRLKKLSFEQIKDIVGLWATLTEKSVVTNSLEDENFIRGLMDFEQRKDEKPEDGDLAEVTKPDTALNGPQVTSMVEVTNSVASGFLAKESAIQILITAYPITLERAKSIIDPIEVNKNENGDANDVGSNDPTDNVNGDSKAASGLPVEPNPRTDDNMGGNTSKPTGDNNSIRLNKDDITKNKMKFAHAIRRVDFASIDRSSEASATTNVDLLAESVLNSVNNLVELFVKTFNFDNPSDKDVQGVRSKVKVTSADKRQMKNDVAKALKEGWKLGQLHADLEIKKALGDKRQLMKKLSFASIEDLAVSYFATKSFNIAGDISDKMESIVRQEILNGVQYTKTQKEVEQAIYDRFVSDGMVKAGQVPADAINAELQSIVPAHRIATIIRTNTFEAINEGRIAFFEDPAINGFVEAYEYSSILDSRTTDICNSLGDPDTPQVHAVGNPVWDVIKPPNHFNSVAKGSLVSTLTGPIKIEDVRVGDKVLTHTGNYRPVYAVMSKPNDTSKIRRIKVSSGRVILVTNEHPILTSKGWERADKVKIGDQVFQSQKQGEIVSGRLTTSQSVLFDSHNRKPFLDEEGIPYQVTSITTGMSSTIKLNINRADDKVEDVTTYSKLMSKFNPSFRKNINQLRFMWSRGFSVGAGSCASRLNPIFDFIHRVIGGHRVRVSFGKFFRCFRVFSSPVVFPSSMFPGGISKASCGTLGSSRDTKFNHKLSESVVTEEKASLNRSNRFTRFNMPFLDKFFELLGISKINQSSLHIGWESDTIISNVEVDYNDRVYNLAVSVDETYLVSDLVVHNCRAILVPIIAGETWTESAPPAVQPAEGFR